MDAPEPPPAEVEFTWNQGLALIIGVPTLVFPPLAYWQYDSSLFGPSPLPTMLAITGVSGALSFALFAGRKRWLIGAFLGFAAGMGAPGAHMLYTSVFHRQSMYLKESGLVCLVGALIPMALLGYILKRDKGA